MPTLGDPLQLRCGLTAPNRIGRAAMTEGLANARNDPTPRHERLYAATAAGGPGLLLTGNVMVDRRHLERARNVVVDSATDREALRRWAAACSTAATLVQLSHPGRQVTRAVQPHPVSPSGGPAVELAGMFATPRALTPAEIEEVRDRFVDAGLRVLDAGFAGVELHAAHGYLLSSFLDPSQNLRTDEWGGSLEGRARLLLEIVRDLRAELPAHAAIAVKLDARHGDDEELAQLGGLLEGAGADLLEVSGGSYEAPAMIGLDGAGHELRSEHESPFWDSARALAAAVSLPVMLTGGFRTRAAMESALESGVAAMIGLGRPLAVDPGLARRLALGQADLAPRPAPRLQGPEPLIRMMAAAANSGWYRLALEGFGRGRGPQTRIPALAAALDYTLRDGLQAATSRRSRMALAARAVPARRPDLEPSRPAPAAGSV